MTRTTSATLLTGLAAIALLIFGSLAIAQDAKEEGSYYDEDEEKAGGIAYEEQEVTLDKETILGVVKRQYPAIINCYEVVLQRERALKGRLVVEWLIRLDGTVRDVKVGEGSTMNNAEVSKCVLEKVQGFRFPSRKSGEEELVRFPFNFVPREET